MEESSKGRRASKRLQSKTADRGESTAISVVQEANTSAEPGSDDICCLFQTINSHFSTQFKELGEGIQKISLLEKAQSARLKQLERELESTRIELSTAKEQWASEKLSAKDIEARLHAAEAQHLADSQQWQEKTARLESDKSKLIEKVDELSKTLEMEVSNHIKERDALKTALAQKETDIQALEQLAQEKEATLIAVSLNAKELKSEVKKVQARLDDETKQHAASKARLEESKKENFELMTQLDSTTVELEKILKESIEVIPCGALLDEDFLVSGTPPTYRVMLASPRSLTSQFDLGARSRGELFEKDCSAIVTVLPCTPTATAHHLPTLLSLCIGSDKSLCIGSDKIKTKVAGETDRINSNGLDPSRLLLLGESGAAHSALVCVLTETAISVPSISPDARAHKLASRANHFLQNSDLVVVVLSHQLDALVVAQTIRSLSLSNKRARYIYLHEIHHSDDWCRTVEQRARQLRIHGTARVDSDSTYWWKETRVSAERQGQRVLCDACGIHLPLFIDELSVLKSKESYPSTCTLIRMISCGHPYVPISTRQFFGSFPSQQVTPADQTFQRKTVRTTAVDVYAVGDGVEFPIHAVSDGTPPAERVKLVVSQDCVLVS